MPFRNAPHTRVLPDTNVWLDAAFCPQSVAHRALHSLRATGAPLLLVDTIENELRSVLVARRIALALRHNPEQHFLSYAASMNCIRVPPAPPEIKVDQVNFADRHVARAAVHYSALLLTGDAPLVAQSRREDIAASFPWTVMVELHGVTPDEILRIIPPTRHNGSIFARVTPTNWLGLKDVGIFTVVDIEHIGRLSFDSRTQEWLFACSFGLVARLAYADVAQGTTVVNVSYSLKGAGLPGNVIMRAGKFGSADRPASSATTLQVHNHNPGKHQIAASLSLDSSWNGHIRHLTIGPETMGTDSWKAVAELEDGAPNPMNHNVLDNALLANEIEAAELAWRLMRGVA